MDKEVRELIEAVIAQGFRAERTKKGWMLYPPDRSKRPVVERRK